jgi:hypothetical protein
MSYTKAEITAVTSTNSVIQGSKPPMKEFGIQDSHGTIGVVTIPAYESDE